MMQRDFWIIANTAAIVWVIARVASVPLPDGVVMGYALGAALNAFSLSCWLSVRTET